MDWERQYERWRDGPCERGRHDYPVRESPYGDIDRHDDDPEVELPNTKREED